MLTENCDSYMNAPSQQVKKDICDHIIKIVRGRFLRLDVDRSCWIEIDDETARTKVAQAFQYRQRRQIQKELPFGKNNGQIQKEPPFGKNNDIPLVNRKRKLSAAASLSSDNGSSAMYQSMQIPQPFEFDATPVTLDELRWVLGSQSSLPQQQQPQQQHYWQQQPNEQIFHQSSSGANTLSSDHISYCDDYAIGMPATMISRQNEEMQQFYQPNNEMNDYFERMRKNAISLPPAVTHPDITASFPMQSQLQQQANQFSEE